MLCSVPSRVMLLRAACLVFPHRHSMAGRTALPALGKGVWKSEELPEEGHTAKYNHFNYISANLLMQMVLTWPCWAIIERITSLTQFLQYGWDHSQTPLNLTSGMLACKTIIVHMKIILHIFGQPFLGSRHGAVVCTCQNLWSSVGWTESKS